MFGLGLAALALPTAAETIDLSPSKDPSAYIPGEAVTITVGGMSTTVAYDLFVRHSNGTDLMEMYNVSSTQTGTYVWPVVIPTDWDGTYYVYAYRNGSLFPARTSSFTVNLFDLNAEANHRVYLPGDTVTVFYFTQRVDNQRPLDSGSGRWRLQIQRDNGSGFVTDNLGEAVTATQGSFSFTLPATTRSNSYTLVLTYNDTTNMHSETATVTIYVGTFNLAVSVDRYPAVYQSGDSVVVSVSATTSYYYSDPTAGVVVTTRVEKYDPGNATWSNDTSYTVLGQTTSQQGTVSFIVTLHQGIADDTILRIFVSAAHGGATQEASAQFTIRAATGFSIDLKLDKTQYKPGETINARLVFVTTNTTLITGAMYHWRVTNSNTNAVLMEDYLAGTSTGSEKTVQIPSDFIGQIYVAVTVFTPDDQTYNRGEYANVFSYAMLMNPLKNAYNPGETMQVDVTLVTDRDCGAGGATFIFIVTPNAGGDPIANGTLTPGGKTARITFVIPGEPDDRYDVNVAASCGGLVAQDSTSVSLAKYLALSISIPDKSFKPGESVTVHYKFVTVGGATMPATTTITVSLYGGAGSLPGGNNVGTRQYDVSAMEGDLTFVVPSTTAADGDLLVIASAGSAGSSSATLFTRPSGGASPVSAAASTANLGVIVAVLALFVGVVALMRRPRPPMGTMGGGESGHAPSSFSDMKPESPKKAEGKGGDHSTAVDVLPFGSAPEPIPRLDRVIIDNPPAGSQPPKSL